MTITLAVSNVKLLHHKINAIICKEINRKIVKVVSSDYLVSGEKIRSFGI